MTALAAAGTRVIFWSMRMGNSDSGMMVLLLGGGCVCCVCVISLAIAGAYFLLPDFKKWVDGLFGGPSVADMMVKARGCGKWSGRVMKGKEWVCPPGTFNSYAWGTGPLPNGGVSGNAIDPAYAKEVGTMQCNTSSDCASYLTTNLLKK